VNVLPFQVRIRIASMVVEGQSLRAISRLTGVHRDTIGRWLTDAGEACNRVHDTLVRDIRPMFIQFDEQWSFVGKKQGHLLEGDSEEFGDWYTFVALDASSKLVIAYRVDKRTSVATCAFAMDVKERVLGKPQITTDGFVAYPDAIEEAFGVDVHYATAVKRYEGDDIGGGEAARRYSPGRLRAIEKTTVMGRPIEEHVSTSYVERFNLNTRMNSRRFTRLTNAFSKRVRPLRAGVALTFVWYNFGRVHGTLRVTPAMEAGLTDHAWSMEELLSVAMEISSTPTDLRDTVTESHAAK
jgi:IS1 family transposase